MRNKMRRLIAAVAAGAVLFTVPTVYGVEKNVRPAGIVDNLEDFSCMKAHENVTLSRRNAENMITASEAGGSIIYESYEDINRFQIYFIGNSEDVVVSMSTDGGKYREVKPKVEKDCITLEEIKGRNRFLKLELQPGITLTGVEVNTKVRVAGGGGSAGNVLVDEFEDFSKMYFHDSGFDTNTDKPEENGGDATRIVRGSAQNGASIVYQTQDDISAVKLKTLYGSARSAGTEPTLNYYFSKDGNAWVDAKLNTVSLDSSGLYQEAKELLDGVPAGMRYFKIEFTDITENTVNWSPKLARLELYYGPLSGPVYSFASNGESGGGNLNAGMEFVTVPSSAEVVETFKSRNMEGVHPRLLATADKFAEIRSRLGEEPYSRWFESLKSTCETYFEKECVPYVQTEVEQEKKDFLGPIREFKARLENLSMMWKLTGEPRYAERAYAELVNAMNFPTLYPEHFLNVGEGVFAFAVAYDWMYDWMTPEQRQETEKGIRKQLDTGYQNMMQGTYFTRNTNNWNGVCCGGLAVAALAIMETDYNYCADLVSAAVKATPKCIVEMAPSGVYPEGPGYWDFGTEYLVYMMSAMDHVLGQDYGLSSIDGFEQAGDFLLFLSSPARNTFNFADSAEGVHNGPQAYWFAERFKNPICSWYQFMACPDGGTWDMIYYNPEYYATPDEVNFPLDESRPGAENFSIFRSSFDDRSGLYAALKGGDNQSSHGDLDIGTFIFDALGQRWALEFGAENYAAAGYWDSGKNGGRWDYYKKRAEGHNTLVINPDMDPDQDPFALDEITDFVTVKGGGYTILDMTNAYADDAASVRRGMMVFDSKQQLLVQDEVECLAPSELYWSMHTSATIEIAEDGKTAMLTRNGEKCLATLQTPVDARFETRPAEPLEGTPAPAGNSKAPSVTVLSIHLRDVLDTQIRVILTPLPTGEVDPERVIPAVCDLDDWEMQDMEKAELTSLNVDGEPLVEFSPNKLVYTIPVPEWVDKPISVEATAKSGKVEIERPDGALGQAVIRVKPEQENVSPATYAVRFVPLPVTSMPENTPMYTPTGVKASAVPEPENVPENTLDNDYTTRWAAEGNQWIRYDLGAEKELGAMGISFMSGDTRINYFKIEVSNDDKNWTTVWDGETSGTTDKLAAYIFQQPVKARYVRFFGYGNSSSAWNSITRVQFFGAVKQNRSFADVAESWAKNEIEELFTAGLIDGATMLYFRPEREMDAETFTDWAAKLCGVDAAALRDMTGSLTRQQAASIIARAAELANIPLVPGDLSGFADGSQISPERQDAVSKVVGSGILRGTGEDTFSPDESLTRDQAAVVLHRLWNMTK